MLGWLDGCEDILGWRDGGMLGRFLGAVVTLGWLDGSLLVREDGGEPGWLELWDEDWLEGPDDGTLDGCELACPSD